MTVYQKKPHYAQKLQKQVYNKSVKPRSYSSGDKIWLNSKFIKNKQNWKLNAKFLNLFWVFYLMDKQTYKLKLLKR